MSSRIFVPLLFVVSLFNTSVTASNPQPSSIEALPTDLDTNLWIPYTTIYPTSPPLVAVEATPTATPEDLQIQERQVTGLSAAAALPVTPTQISPITTYNIGMVDRAGVHQWVAVVYTQTFPKIPDQWEKARVGTIGMGTIEGQIGVIKTKRGLEVDVPLPTPPAAPEAVLQVVPDSKSQQNGNSENVNTDVTDESMKEVENGSSRNTVLTALPISLAAIGFGVIAVSLL